MSAAECARQVARAAITEHEWWRWAAEGGPADARFEAADDWWTCPCEGCAADRDRHRDRMAGPDRVLVYADAGGDA